MAYDIYDASIPPLIHMLGSLSHILSKGEAHGGIDPTEARLAPDMLPLNRQVHIATDGAKGCGGRLAGVEIPKFEDTETTFPELKARIAKTIDYLKSVDRAKFAGAEDRPIELKTPNRTLNFTGAQFVTGFALPNFFFHVTTAYALLRHNGIEIGKMDYLGGG